MSRFLLYAPDYASVATIRCSPPSFMVHIALEEKRANYELRWLDFAKGEHRTDAMRALNPRGTIPVLVEGDAVVTESLAMLEYLEYRCPDPPLLPRTPERRALALSRLHEASAVKVTGMALFRRLMTAETAPSEWAALREELRHWELHLAEHPWLSGEEFGLADLCIFAYFAVAVRLGLETTATPELSALCRRIEGRPSVAAAWPTTWRLDSIR